MASTLHIPLGAPGIYKMPVEPVRALTGVRMDVCAFVGVAPRGPAREPVVNEKWPADRPFVELGRPRQRTVPIAVESFDEYRRVFGTFQGPGLLPYAVASFFEQGGQRAYVARIVHQYSNPSDDLLRVASGVTGGCSSTAGPILLHARNEGTWGNGLTAELTFNRTPASFVSATGGSISFADDVIIPIGSRLECTQASGTIEIRTVIGILRKGNLTQAGYTRVTALDAPLSGIPTAVYLLEGTLDVSDGDGRSETFDHLGLGSLHARWMGTVISAESQLVFPDAAWTSLDISPNAAQAATEFTGGIDAYEQVTPEDFFDDTWTYGDDDPGDGVFSLAQLEDLSLLVVPDLYSPFPLAPLEPILDPPSLAGPEFATCVEAAPAGAKQLQPVADLAGLRLDPRIPSELAQIVALQQRLEDFCSLMEAFIVLLDVPPGLSQRQILQWRTPFRSAYAASYHPWLEVARNDDDRDALMRIPPSSTAAGLIARSEILFGVPTGPANLLAAQIVNVSDIVSPSRHDELHPAGINVYLRDRDGVRLSAARTLSRDLSFRQLSVRRLITLIRRTLGERMQWMVFEPNDSSLRSEVRALLSAFLRSLGRLGAFAGATEEESYFIRCDASNNIPADVDAGRLLAEIGVAPAEPLEFIVLSLSGDADGTFTAEE